MLVRARLVATAITAVMRRAVLLYPQFSKVPLMGECDVHSGRARILA